MGNGCYEGVKLMEKGIKGRIMGEGMEGEGLRVWVGVPCGERGVVRV